MLFSKLLSLASSSSHQTSRRRKTGTPANCVRQCDTLEPRVLLSADNQTPVITFAVSEYSVVLIELQDMWAHDVTIWIDAEADGTFEGSVQHEGIGLPTIISVPGDIPPNGEKLVAVKAVRNIVGGEDATEHQELTSNVVTLTAKGHELLPVVPSMLDVYLETVWGEIDGQDIVGTVDIVYKQGEEWISVGNVTDSRGVFTLSAPQSTVGQEITLTTRHSWMGVDVYGPIYTFFNEPIGDFWAEDPATGPGDANAPTDPGTSETPPIGGPEDGTTETPPAVDPENGTSDPPPTGGPDGGGEEWVGEEPAAMPSDGSFDTGAVNTEPENDSSDEAIDQFMADLGTDDDWYDWHYAEETETEDDYAAFFDA